MSGNEPQPKSVRRRFRRRALRSVHRLNAILDVRRQLENRGNWDDFEQSDSDGSIEDGRSTSSSSEDISANSNDDGRSTLSSNEDNSVNSNDQYEESTASEGEVHEENGANFGVGYEHSGSDSSDNDPGTSDSDIEDGAVHNPVENVNNMTAAEKEAYLNQCLREWASSGGVLSMRKVDELLGKLSFVFKTVKKSYKTLLGTSRDAPIHVGDGFCMWYKSIKVNLDQMELGEYINVYGRIKISINIDGLPLNKNVNSKKFWPILGKLDGSDDPPFIIAIYFGTCDLES
ncbi:Replicase polyprotein 1a [Frankliniella fusca]|uniref:Replicase polyprotein 1a n=1 Tax=Frankliniella fusca TaxID=407009 RepID=A0AAE1HVP0_9NEOP|nr:Replicase polyprotein 1a [Frankliniella fusca]